MLLQNKNGKVDVLEEDPYAITGIVLSQDCKQLLVAGQTAQVLRQGRLQGRGMVLFPPPSGKLRQWKLLGLEFKMIMFKKTLFYFAFFNDKIILLVLISDLLLFCRLSCLNSVKRMELERWLA